METEKEKKQFTIIIYSESRPWVLYRIANIFAKRRVNIESLTVSESEKENFARFTIKVQDTDSKVEVVCKQLERVIEIEAAKFYSENELLSREVALLKYRVSKENENEFLNLIHKFDANIEHKSEEFYHLSLMGSESLIDDFKSMAKGYELVEFVRSGRISVTKNN